MTTQSLWLVRLIIAVLYTLLVYLLVALTDETMTPIAWVVLVGITSLTSCLIVRHGDD